jgi:hypothetical protein
MFFGLLSRVLYVAVLLVLRLAKNFVAYHKVLNFEFYNFNTISEKAKKKKVEDRRWSAGRQHQTFIMH